VGRLHRRRAATWPLALLLLLSLAALLAAAVVAGGTALDGTPVDDWWQSVVSWVERYV
jgi:hypothetical protein